MIKRIVLIIIFGLVFSQIYSDDTHIVIGAGGVGYYSNKEDENISGHRTFVWLRCSKIKTMAQ